jgi:hypothetical protein
MDLPIMPSETSVALGGVIASLVAVVATVILSMIQMGAGQRLAQSDMLLRLRSGFDEGQMRLVRARAARGLQQNEWPNEALSHGLDWISQIGWLLESKVITPELAFKHFGYWVLGYWSCGQGFVHRQRTTDAGSWQSLEATIAILKKVKDWAPDEKSFLHHEVLQANLCLLTAEDVESARTDGENP